MNNAWDDFVSFCEQFGGTEFSLAVQQALGLEAIAILRQQALRGNTRAAMYLCDRWLGQPELPITAQMNDMSADEIHAELTRRGWRRAGGDGE